MKSTAFYSILTLGVILMGCIAWFGIHQSKPSGTSQTQTASSTTSGDQSQNSVPQKPLTGLSIYTNGTYGFSLVYPATTTASTTFSATYHLPATWQAGDLGQNPGTPLIQLLGYHTMSDNSFPRYFEAEVRVGASTDHAALAACLNASSGETKMADTSINGVTWKTFSFQSVGMMQYVKGSSYRTIHEKSCFALEQLETGSSYQDDKSSAKDVSQSTLDSAYTSLTPIVQSFSFVRP
jgi:hypothetical protein